MRNNLQDKCGKVLFKVFPQLSVAVQILYLKYFLMFNMVKTKQTARKHTDGGANLGKKTRLRRAVGADMWWGTAKQTFVEPKAGRLRSHTNDPNRLDYRHNYNIHYIVHMS